MKPILKVGFTDYFNPVDEFFIDVLKEDYTILRDDQNPDYLFFCDETFGTNNLNYDPRKVTKIFYTGENRRPWNYQAHHAITFDHMEGPQYYRLPLYVLENWVNTHKVNLPDAYDYAEFRQCREWGFTIQDKGFCSFVVRNPNCPERNEVFHKLSEYKPVTSGGPLFNNIGGPIDQDGFNSHTTKINFIKKYKFHIAYENGSYPGYVTEKILHGFLGDSIPIYWGSPTVELDFYPESFVNRHDFSSLDDMIAHIKYLDQNEDAYRIKMGKYMFNYHNKFLELHRFRTWFRENVYHG